MMRRLREPRDPFEGKAERRRRVRVEAEEIIALALAIIACGLTAAVWLRTLAPLADRLT